MAFDADGKWIASVSEDKFMRLWDAATGKLIQRFVGHEDSVRAVGFIPGKTQVVTGSNDRTVRLWDLVDPLQRQSFSGLVNNVQGLTFNGDETMAIAGSWDAVIFWWDVKSGQKIGEFTAHKDNGGRTFADLAYDPVHNRVLSADGRNVFIWDFGSGQMLAKLAGHEDFVNGVAIDAEGNQAVTGDASGAVLVWDLTGLPSSGTDDAANAPEVSPAQVFTLPESPQAFSISDVAISPDGKSAALSSYRGEVAVFDLERGEARWRKQIGDKAIYVAAYNPKGDRILTASDDSVIQIWDAANGNWIRNFWGHGNAILSAEFSTDGNHILSSGYLDRTVRLWDVESGRELSRLQFNGETIKAHLSQASNEALVGLGNGQVLLSEVLPLERDTLIRWAQNNRYVPKFSCSEQYIFRIEPLDPQCTLQASVSSS